MNKLQRTIIGIIILLSLTGLACDLIGDGCPAGTSQSWAKDGSVYCKVD